MLCVVAVGWNESQYKKVSGVAHSVGGATKSLKHGAVAFVNPNAAGLAMASVLSANTSSTYRFRPGEPARISAICCASAPLNCAESCVAPAAAVGPSACASGVLPTSALLATRI